MRHPYTLPLDDPQATLAVAGGKGASLARLCRAGLPVPGGFHVTTAAYRLFVEANGLQAQILEVLGGADPDLPDSLESCSKAIRALFEQNETPPEVAGDIARAYDGLSGQSPSVAVRSSATAEDLPGLSFAGQQETYLNIHGPAAVIEAVQRCWASLWTSRAIGYRIRHGIDQSEISLAVVVQLLVPAETAGIMFTANPVTGARGEAVLSAAWGLGEAVVGGLVTPDTLTVDKATGQLLSRETADKQVKTVRTELGTEEQPVPGTLRRVPVLSDDQAAELVRLGVQIETLYDQPVDVEWAWVDGHFSIVQARPITALPEPELAPPTEWPMPDPKGHYMRASIVDLMPDPVTPLFATTAFQAYEKGIARGMADITRSVPVLSAPMVTINGYVYSDANYSLGMTWWMLTVMLPNFPRMMRDGVAYWREHGRAPYLETARHWESQALSELSATSLLEGAHELVDAAMRNLTAQMIWMGACAGSEMLFTRVYDKMVKRDGDPDATTFLVGWDSTPIHAEKSLYDLATWCGERDTLSTALLDTPSEQVLAWLENGESPPNVAADHWQHFRERFLAHVQRFGHIIYDLDFGKALPLDDPTPMLETVKLHLRGQGTDPYERQQSLESRRVQSTEHVLQRTKRLRRWAFTTTLRWAQRLSSIREDGLADIGLGYPILRRILREIGQRLVDAQALEHPDDVFWLQDDELVGIVSALDKGEPVPSMAAHAQERRAFSRAAARATPPPVLPPSKRKVLGISIEGAVAVDADSQAGDTLKGAGTSTGQVTAPACVLQGPEDFGNMQPGTVLVAKATTPAWTPLFAMAAAVVTDIGGPLSHGSIVAREYGIPAVMGTGVATRRIRSGQTVTVDGSQGLVFLDREKTR
jgi:phosphohistidine swiveling domain-containing protein